MIWMFLVLGSPWFTNPLNVKADLKQLHDEESSQSLQLQAWKQKCQQYVDLEALASAEELIDRLIEVFHGEPVFHDLKMIIYREKGQLDLAITVGEKILMDYPGYKPIYLNLAFVYLEKEDGHAKALNLLFSEKGNPLRLRDWAKISKTLNAVFKSREAVLAFLLEKTKTYPHRAKLNQLVLAYLIRLGAYERATLWISERPELMGNSEIQQFLIGMETFEKP